MQIKCEGDFVPSIGWTLTRPAILRSDSKRFRIVDIGYMSTELWVYSADGCGPLATHQCDDYIEAMKRAEAILAQEQATT